MDPVVLRQRAICRAFELYFERLDKQAGLGNIKRPDLLIFDSGDTSFVDGFLNRLGGYRKELPFIPEETLDEFIQKALIAVECENSLWVAKEIACLW